MAKRRARTSDTAAISTMPVGDNDGPSSVSVSVRKIANGYVSTHSREQDGNYSYKEEFHEKKPRIEELVGGGDKIESGMNESVNHLKAAVGLMNRGRA